MRVGHLAVVALGWVVMLAPAARTRAEPAARAVPGAQQHPPLAAPAAKQEMALSGVAPERTKRRIGIVAANGALSGRSLRRARAVMATAIENAVHGPGTEPPMWGDPVGIDVRAAASVIMRAQVAPRHAASGTSSTAAADQR